MQEKQQNKALNRATDAIYAQQVAQRVANVEGIEAKLKDQKTQAKHEYHNTLNEQIKTEKQRKKYDILMTEHERRIHDKTIKAYEHFQSEVTEESSMPKLGANNAVQQRYIGKAFATGSNPNVSPMMSSAKRPNLNEVTSIQAVSNPYGATSPGTISTGSLPKLNQNPIGQRQQSQLAMAGSQNILGISTTKASTIQQADEQRLKKVMDNMEKDKAL